MFTSEAACDVVRDKGWLRQVPDTVSQRSP